MTKMSKVKINARRKEQSAERKVKSAQRQLSHAQMEAQIAALEAKIALLTGEGPVASGQGPVASETTHDSPQASSLKPLEKTPAPPIFRSFQPFLERLAKFPAWNEKTNDSSRDFFLDRLADIENGVILAFRDGDGVRCLPRVVEFRLDMPNQGTSFGNDLPPPFRPFFRRSVFGRCRVLRWCRHVFRHKDFERSRRRTGKMRLSREFCHTSRIGFPTGDPLGGAVFQQEPHVGLFQGLVFLGNRNFTGIERGKSGRPRLLFASGKDAQYERYCEKYPALHV